MKNARSAFFGLVAIIAIVAAIAFVARGRSATDAPATDTIEESPFEQASDDTQALEPDDEMRDIIVAQDEPIVSETSMLAPGYGPEFENLTIDLATGFPVGSPQLPSYLLSYETSLSVDEMKEVATLFGFDGELYIERLDYGMEVDAFSDQEETDEGAELDEDEASATDAATDPATEVDIAVDGMPFPPQMNYVAFDGTRRLSFYGISAHFQDLALIDQLWGPNPTATRMSFEDALPIAEQFLVERDLLPDEYVSKVGWDNTVHFHELLDGAIFNRPVAIVYVLADGQIAQVEYMPVIKLQRLDAADLISAETAFDSLTEQPHRYQFNYLPSVNPQDNEAFPMPRNWQREAAMSGEVTRNTWLQVFESAADGAPLIWADNMPLLGDPALIAQLAAEGAQRSVSITGTIDEVDGVDQFTVTAYSVSEVPQDVYLNGTIGRDGDTVQLVVPGGLTVVLPDAPDDIETGLAVGVYGFSITNAEGGQPIFDWLGIDEQIDYSSFEESYMDDMGPYSSESLVIDDVILIYQPNYNEMAMAPYPEPYNGERFEPMWQFSGETENGSTLEFWVPAISADTGN